MRHLKFIATGIFTLILGFNLASTSGSETATEKNHCFSCHTNPQKLIQITRQLEKVRKPTQAKSTLTKGEG
ncbi:MAG: hypothetical protein PVJ84_12585 [Desulfobacteraceae bacterium]|jgi:hypothetical protein